MLFVGSFRRFLVVVLVFEFCSVCSLDFNVAFLLRFLEEFWKVDFVCEDGMACRFFFGVKGEVGEYVYGLEVRFGLVVLFSSILFFVYYSS